MEKLGQSDFKSFALVHNLIQVDGEARKEGRMVGRDEGKEREREREGRETGKEGGREEIFIKCLICI